MAQTRRDGAQTGTRKGGATFAEVLDQAIVLLQRRGRLTYRTLKRRFQLDDAALEDLTVELITGQRLAVDEGGEVLVWSGDSVPPPVQAGPQRRRWRRSYSPTLSGREDFDVPQCPGRRTQAGHRAFADLKGSDGTPRRP